MQSIRISKAKISDSQLIRKLERNVWSEDVVSKWDASAFARFGYVYVAKHRGKIIGSIVAFKTKDDEIFVNDWVVHKKYRRKKVGQKLYERLIKDVKQPIITFLDEKNTFLLKTHLKLGFKFVKRIKGPYNVNESYRIFVRRKPKKRR
ncbi:MAG: GNAT family N-acetyltransferase [Candidatus Aenigmatarchaeota archaeon]|nr:GNAT family N-acetyltransferase [Candidatus Aenigmarchaeota archaeon]